MPVGAVDLPIADVHERLQVGGLSTQGQLRAAGGERFRLQGVVVWAAEAGETREGFGVWLLDPPEAWRKYCSELVAGSPPEPAGSDED